MTTPSDMTTGPHTPHVVNDIALCPRFTMPMNLWFYTTSKVCPQLQTHPNTNTPWTRYLGWCIWINMGTTPILNNREVMYHYSGNPRQPGNTPINSDKHIDLHNAPPSYHTCSIRKLGLLIESCTKSIRHEHKELYSLLHISILCMLSRCSQCGGHY